MYTHQKKKEKKEEEKVGAIVALSASVPPSSDVYDGEPRALSEEEVKVLAPWRTIKQFAAAVSVSRSVMLC